ncbi:MAG: helix-turn-helix transcriptional regulator [Kutzneria sp.]|nr:helix-turn-helix transcriptional regulator [Kutzneria sp.]
MAPRVSPEHRRLMEALRDLRCQAGLSGEQFGHTLGWSQSKVSKIENGRTKPSIDDVTTWVNRTNAAPEWRTELLELAQSVANEARSWSTAHEAGLAERQREIADVEAATVHLRNFQPAIVPGLLQTADYARRVLTLADVSGQRDIPTAVANRLERQTVLYKQDKQFDFVLVEGALRWRPGPDELMHAQMDRLLSLETLPNVSLSVIPFDSEATSLYLNGFTIFDVPDDPAVLVETLSHEFWLNDTSNLTSYRHVFDDLSEAAVTGQRAHELIRSAMSPGLRR